MTGREHNDPMRFQARQSAHDKKRLRRRAGGISNGETVHFPVAFKPVATVMHEQDTVKCAV
ncbi:MAG: hypothetical protein Ct9H300mP7_5120 [Verrucomicrobiota bacterium]|nr:MAG: hypothetical protein Ct9H300mP7_5120 [Verrucomicrobiota bacterium]